jgi:hypothetical protein
LFGTTNTIQDGNLVLTGTAAGNSQRVGAMAVSSGKWYYEVTLTTLPASMDPLAGFTEINNASAVTQYPGQATSSYAIYHISTNTFLQKVNAGAFTNTNTSVASQGDILGVALDLSSGKIWFSKNGTYVDSGNPATGSNAQFTGLSGTFVPAVRGTGGVTTTTITANFGQRPFAYTAPSGFKALCTQNLPQPTIQKPSKYMDALAYTGTGASNSISSLGFSPDLVWIKNRGTTTDHAIYDIVRGAQQQLSSNTTGSEVTSSSGLTAFDSAGFTIGTSSLVNTSGTQYVAWAWDAGSTTSTNTSGSITSTVRANPQAGFSIVSYTGTGANATVGHGLGVAPKMVIVKARNQSGLSYSWVVGTDAVTNGSAVNYISYCFSEIEGYSKFGSYTGNGSSDGPFVWCGFRPRWVITKRTDATDVNWNIFDSSRNSGNAADLVLYSNRSNADASYGAGEGIDINSNGFKIREVSTDINASGGTYIFAAFAESPFKYARAR